MAFNIEYIDETQAIFKETAEQVEKQLLRSLRSDLVQSENQSFVLIAKSGRNEIVGGLTASSSYEWLLIKTLWVKESFRELGLGKQLLRVGEKKGQIIGCHSAWLDTSNPVAEQFYRSNGYCEFGRLENSAEQKNTIALPMVYAEEPLQSVDILE